MKGKKPKPINQRIAEGDLRHVGTGKLEQQRLAQIKAVRGLPDAPQHLNAVAREQWAIWKQDLELMEQDYHADAVMLEGACVNYARALEQDEILRHGCQVEEAIIDKATGVRIGTRLRNHPAVAVSNACWRNVHAFCSDQGLSLVSRQRLAIDAPDHSTQDLMKLLGAARTGKDDDRAILEAIQ